MFHNKWCLLTGFVMVGSFNSFSAMDLTIGHREKDDERIVVARPRQSWSCDYTRRVDSVKDFNLPILRAEQEKKQYLEKGASSLEHLLYLSTIQEGNTKTLFTEKQQDRFTDAKKVKDSVVQFFYINGSIILFTMLFPYTNFMSKLQCADANQTNCLSQNTVIAAPATISLAGALVLGFISLYATGINPNNSANKADKVQDAINDLNRSYSTLAKYLIDIHFEYSDKAKYIADKFDIEELKKRAQVKTYKSEIGASFIISPLEEACHYIKQGNILPQFTQIESYVYNKIHSQNIEQLIKQNAALIERAELLEKQFLKETTKKEYKKDNKKKYEKK